MIEISVCLCYNIFSLEEKRRSSARINRRADCLTTSGDTINIDVYIDVIIGFSCAEVAYRVQENVKRSVESMTNLKTGTVNVNVLGVCFDETV